MNIIYNGKKKKITGRTVKELFKELNINSTGRIIAVNGRVVPWTEYGKFLLKERDTVEIRSAISGG
ncbi:MAG: sulfur carrier protein ThiS [bacterium]